MATKIVNYQRIISNTSGQFGSMEMQVEDNVIIGVKIQIASVWLQQAGIGEIANVYNELAAWATANGYTWIAG